MELFSTGSGLDVALAYINTTLVKGADGGYLFLITQESGPRPGTGDQLFDEQQFEA